MCPFPRQTRRSVAPPILEHLGVYFDRLIQRHVHTVLPVTSSSYRLASPLRRSPLAAAPCRAPAFARTPRRDRACRNIPPLRNSPAVRTYPSIAGTGGIDDDPRRKRSSQRHGLARAFYGRTFLEAIRPLFPHRLTRPGSTVQKGSFLSGLGSPSLTAAKNQANPPLLQALTNIKSKLC